MTISKPPQTRLKFGLSFWLSFCLLWLWTAPAWSQTVSLQQALERAQPQLGFTRLPPEEHPAREPDSSYALGPGDQLTVLLWNAQINLNYELVVNPRGQILIPRLGLFEAEGRTLEQLETSILQRSQEIQRDRLQVRLFLRQIRRVQVLITGYVNRPGYYQLYWGTPLLEALRRAGGVRDNGSVRQIHLERPDAKIPSEEHIDLFRFHYAGDRSANPLLTGGEQIHVPPITQRVAVLGEVQQAGIYEILPGERASEVLTWAGGPRPTADPTGLQRWARGLEQGGEAQLRPTQPQTPLQNGDILYLPSRKIQGVDRKVFIHGQIRQSSAISWQNGLSLLDLIQQAGGELPSADLSRVQISRIQNGQRQQLEVNLEAYLKGQNPEGNPELQAEDVVQIPESFWNVRTITELTTLVLSTLGIVSVAVNLSRTQ